MTIAEIRDALNDIQQNAISDPEHAHSVRDTLFEDVLWAIANDNYPRNYCAILAKEALRAKDIKLKWEACF